MRWDSVHPHFKLYLIAMVMVIPISIGVLIVTDDFEVATQMSQGLTLLVTLCGLAVAAWDSRRSR